MISEGFFLLLNNCIGFQYRNFGLYFVACETEILWKVYEPCLLIRLVLLMLMIMNVMMHAVCCVIIIILNAFFCVCITTCLHLSTVCIYIINTESFYSAVNLYN